MPRVVVTGMGVVAPIGIGIGPFFDGLRSARAGVDRIASFDAGRFPTRIGAEVNGFDLDTTGLSDRERSALSADPKSAFGVTAARQALAAAFGDVPISRCYPEERVGVVAAAGLEIFHLDDLVPLFSDGAIDGRALRDHLFDTPVFTNLQIPADLGARAIARLTGAGGMVQVNVSACAAGTQALGEAFLAIRQGVLDVAVTGGYDSMLNPLGVGGFCMLEALSTANDLGPGASRPFDKHRDGFVLGEGAGFCILENAQSALARGATIHGEVLGYSSSMDAYRVTDPAPDQAGAIRAMRGALASAGLSPAQVDYINAHGTGTRKNDPAETRAIKKVFGSRARQIPVSSTKSQIGHLIGAAGAVEFIAGLFALNEQLLPATINLVTPDPQCDLDYVPGTPRQATVEHFMSNSFGFGGQNACIVAGQWSP